MRAGFFGYFRQAEICLKLEIKVGALGEFSLAMQTPKSTLCPSAESEKEL
jgi:hypothetical protein